MSCLGAGTYFHESFSAWYGVVCLINQRALSNNKNFIHCSRLMEEDTSERKGEDAFINTAQSLNVASQAVDWAFRNNAATTTDAFQRFVPGSSTAMRSNGKLAPIMERIVRLGRRGGLYEIRPKFKGRDGQVQRISLVKRDQLRCLNNTLRGAGGVCGHIEKVAGSTEYKHLMKRADEVCEKCNKEYGSFALVANAPERVRQFVDTYSAAREEMPPVAVMPTTGLDNTDPTYEMGVDETESLQYLEGLRHWFNTQDGVPRRVRQMPDNVSVFAHFPNLIGRNVMVLGGDRIEERSHGANGVWQYINGMDKPGVCVDVYVVSDTSEDSPPDLSEIISPSMQTKVQVHHIQTYEYLLRKCVKSQYWRTKFDIELTALQYLFYLSDRKDESVVNRLRQSVSSDECVQILSDIVFNILRNPKIRTMYDTYVQQERDALYKHLFDSLNFRRQHNVSSIIILMIMFAAVLNMFSINANHDRGCGFPDIRQNIVVVSNRDFAKELIKFLKNIQTSLSLDDEVQSEESNMTNVEAVSGTPLIVFRKWFDYLGMPVADAYGLKPDEIENIEYLDGVIDWVKPPNETADGKDSRYVTREVLQDIVLFAFHPNILGRRVMLMGEEHNGDYSSKTVDWVDRLLKAYPNACFDVYIEDDRFLAELGDGKNNRMQYIRKALRSWKADRTLYSNVRVHMIDFRWKYDPDIIRSCTQPVIDLYANAERYSGSISMTTDELANFINAFMHSRIQPGDRQQMQERVKAVLNDQNKQCAEYLMSAMFDTVYKYMAKMYDKYKHQGREQLYDLVVQCVVRNTAYATKWGWDHFSLLNALMDTYAVLRMLMIHDGPRDTTPTRCRDSKYSKYIIYYAGAAHAMFVNNVLLCLESQLKKLGISQKQASILLIDTSNPRVSRLREESVVEPGEAPVGLQLDFIGFREQ